VIEEEENIQRKKRLHVRTARPARVALLIDEELYVNILNATRWPKHPHAYIVVDCVSPAPINLMKFPFYQQLFLQFEELPIG
jgi:hypothetical protein